MSKENLEKVPSATERRVSASDCPQNPPCTACILLRCKTGCNVSTCATCTFTPEKCSLSSIMKSRPSACCSPSPLCSPRCPPLRCSTLPPSCCPPPRCSVPPRCFRCCELTGNSKMPMPNSMCPPRKVSDICCPPPRCDPCCSPPKYSPCCPPLRLDPCCPPLKPDPCCPPLKPNPCCPPPRPDPCCPPPKCDAPASETPKAATPPPEKPEVTKTPSIQEQADPCPKSPPPVHRCPSDVETERPKYFTENITGDYTWKMYGVRIQYTDPESPGTSATKVGQPLTVKLGVEVKASSCLSGDVITAYMWTHMKTLCNPCGTWKDLPLHFQPELSSVGECGIKRFVYSSTLTPTVDDTFRLTFNIKWGNIMIWANNYGDDNFVGVAQN